jgi:hypothetical protein
MRYYHQPTGIYCATGALFALGDTQYPANWLEFATPDQIANIGLAPVVINGVRGDEALFDNSEVTVAGVCTITATPKDANVLKLARWENLTASPWQIRKALNQTGLRNSIEAAVAAGDQTVKDAWQYATEFRRDNPLVSQMGAALGKTEADLDDLFALAKSL